MFTVWDDEFDRVCGANITSTETNPLEDSGVWDILHGPERHEAAGGASGEASAKVFRPVPEYRGGSCPFHNR